ncbi:MAG: hypothetical protein WC342_02880 [Methanoregula sp.]|jgi:hypothetical protein
MRGLPCVVAAVALLCLIVPVPAWAAPSVTINATPDIAHLGDTITLSGTVTGIQTIVVFLFVTGPDLDSRGVTLDNLNIPAGHGLFTTAPVDMDRGTWTYDWDTSVILGNMNPGKYKVFVVTSPVDRLRSGEVSYATADVTFLPPETSENPIPLSPLTAIFAFVIIAGGGSCMIRRLEKQ